MKLLYEHTMTFYSAMKKKENKEWAGKRKKLEKCIQGNPDQKENAWSILSASTFYVFNLEYLCNPGN